MAVVTKDNEDKKPMADDAEDQRPEPLNYARPGSNSVASTGFFSIYKSGQGYWTRLGTIGGAGVILALIARFIYTTAVVRLTAVNTSIVGGVVAVVSLIAAAIIWHYLNKPSIVDFFIATESEMKKVNWTSRKELIGSTKVVIGFMFITATFLFLADMFFGYFFWLIHVLKNKPF